MLAAGGEAGGLALRWAGWTAPAAVGLVLGTLVFRFPRSVGLPALAVLGTGLWWAAGQLQSFEPASGAVPPVLVQPMTDRELVTVFRKRVDWLEFPELPLVPRSYYRLRESADQPPELWWAWAEAAGWAWSAGAPVPEPALRFGLYRLELTRDPPVWRPIQPSFEGSSP